MNVHLVCYHSIGGCKHVTLFIRNVNDLFVLRMSDILRADTAVVCVLAIEVKREANYIENCIQYMYFCVVVYTISVKLFSHC